MVCITGLQESQMVSLRLPADLVVWATEYAERRGVSRTELLASAIESFKEDCDAGVPEVRELRKRVLTRPVAKQTREQFNESTEARALLFSTLRIPVSIKGSKRAA